MPPLHAHRTGRSPGDQHVIEDHERIDLVKAVGEWVILDRGAAGKAGATNELEVRRAEVANKADRIIGKLGIAPIGDGRLREGLLGVGGGGFELGAARDDADLPVMDAEARCLAAKPH